jgi:spore maturation protein CgeB
VWPGLEEILEPEAEILLAETPDDVLRHLRDLAESERRAIAARARQRVLAEHTARRRCDQLERLVLGAAV